MASSASPRDRLLAAATALCAEFGFEEIEEGEIARRAEVSEQTLYELFPDGKESCLAAAESAVLSALVTAVSRAYLADRSEWENALFGVKEILEYMAANPDQAYLGYIFSRQMAPGEIRALNENGHLMMAAMLDRGRDYSRVGGQPGCAALGILGGAQAIVRRELVAGKAWRLPHILPDCVYIATVPFLGQHEALRLARQAEALRNTERDERDA